MTGRALGSTSEGEANKLVIAMKGTFAGMFSEDLGKRVHRGLEERAIQGLSAGGHAYGYTIERQWDAKGERIGGLHSINENEATIVRRIFEEYASGKSPRRIAHDLNAENIPARNGSTWRDTTINGNRRRGTGVLNNNRYRGVMVWNRQRFTTDPETGRTNDKLKDESEWITSDVPHLRIVSDELWNRVKAYQKALDDKPTGNAKNRAKYPLSGLLRCGCCSAGMSKISATQYGCSARRAKGTCDNAVTISVNRLESAVLSALSKTLFDPARCEVFCREYVAHLNRLQGDRDSVLRTQRAELAKVERDIAKLIDVIKNGVDASLIRDEINGLQERRVGLKAAVEATPSAPVFVHPNMAHRYHVEIQRLIVSLNDPDHRERSNEIIRKLIDKIVLTPNEDRSALVIDLYGDLAGILHVAVGREPTSNPDALSYVEASEIQQVRIVSGGASRPFSDTATSTVNDDGWGGRIQGFVA